MPAQSGSILLILFVVTTNALAQIMLKQGMTQVGPIALDTTKNPALVAIGVLLQPWIMAGLVTFVISMACHMVVLSRVDLSFAYPFLSLAYIMVAVWSFYVFQEEISAVRLAGYGFIVFGTLLIAFSGGDAASSRL